MKNWAHKDIKFKELIDYGFPLPTFTFNSTKIIYHTEDFDFDGFKAATFGVIPPDLLDIHKDIWSLIPEIDKNLNTTFN
jgi:hypothetical protein